MRVFEQDDFKKMNPQKAQIEEYALMQSRESVLLPWIEEERNTVTILHDETPIVIIGIIPDPGISEVWALISKDISRAGLVMATKNINLCAKVMKGNGHTILKTPIRVDFEQGKRWARMFDMKPTGKKEDMFKNGIEYEYWRKEL